MLTSFWSHRKKSPGLFTAGRDTSASYASYRHGAQLTSILATHFLVVFLSCAESKNRNMHQSHWIQIIPSPRQDTTSMLLISNHNYWLISLKITYCLVFISAGSQNIHIIIVNFSCVHNLNIIIIPSFSSDKLFWKAPYTPTPLH
jgi:hypothetical protein